MIDPQGRSETAVTQCKEAGIIPVMITGDHKAQRQAVAMVLGLLIPKKT
jgi:Ca2+-transporting ATPase